MLLQDTVRRNKTAIQMTLSADRILILNKVHEKDLITRREYINLKSINKEDVEGHVIELVDKIMNKGEDTCQAFLDLLQTDDEIKTTYPELQSLQLNNINFLPKPISVSSIPHIPEYQLNSQPTGLCVIINNQNFTDMKQRSGTYRDAQSLAEVFSELGFRVLMCEDQTKHQMDQALRYFAPKHGDAFICCILSHGKKGVVLGVDGNPLSIKQITRTFTATDQSALTGKPKVFLIQACQGGQIQKGVLLEDLQADDSHSQFIPEEADVLVAIATVEDYAAFRHSINGSWFVQSVCQQLKEGCPRGDDMTTILHRVNNDVAQKEGSSQPGALKQMPEVRFTLRKRLVLPHRN
uniref:Caspase-8 n=1 Tax=Dicentrarchus labrax TaxID=13489 RepID=A0A8P4GKR1_DICLA